MSGALLHLYNIQYEDSAGYECEAINQKWQDWHQAWLYVEAAPEWAVTINNTQKDIGSEHTMSCVANGKPVPYIRWLKDGYSVKMPVLSLLSFFKGILHVGQMITTFLKGYMYLLPQRQMNPVCMSLCPV
uniref:Ig-like domain-containing protein n=1 Tax=Hucho hucho TaxID=62062 RepID=A0A4W5KK77_9TELE